MNRFTDAFKQGQIDKAKGIDKGKRSPTGQTTTLSALFKAQVDSARGSARENE